MNRKQGLQLRDLDFTGDDIRYITAYPVFSQRLRQGEWDRLTKMLEIELYKDLVLFGETIPDEIIIDSPDFFVWSECGGGSQIAIDIYEAIVEYNPKKITKGDKVSQVYIEGFDECD